MHMQRFLERSALVPRNPDLKFLAELARSYSALPYENVTKILKEARTAGAQQKFRLTEEVFEDHMRWNTGGTCFSLCNALQDLLTDCGFDSFIAMGDMHYGPNIHCAVVVRLAQGSFLLDPGYLLHQPIRLPELETRVPTTMNTVIVKNEGSYNFSLFTEENGTTKWRYLLKAIPTAREEFERHWEHSYSLNSMEAVILSRANENGRLYYRKDRMELVAPNQRIKQKITPDDHQTLSQMFGLPADLIAKAQSLKS
jgi:arylamine N-acetyltransferase